MKTGDRRCHYCPNRAQGRDHIVPRCLIRRLGLPKSFHQHNTVPCCNDCNQAKGAGPTMCGCYGCQNQWALYHAMIAMTEQIIADHREVLGG